MSCTLLYLVHIYANHEATAFHTLYQRYTPDTGTTVTGEAVARLLRAARVFYGSYCCSAAVQPLRVYSFYGRQRHSTMIVSTAAVLVEYVMYPGFC